MPSQIYSHRGDVPRPASTRVAPIPLSELAVRTAGLVEQAASQPSAFDEQLRRELTSLVADLDRLTGLAAAGLRVSPRRVRDAAQRYLWLRERCEANGLAA